MHHRTEQIDLRGALPPVRHETAQIDLSGGLAGGLPIPPRPRRQGRRLGVDVGSVRVGVALSDPTGTLASPLETVQRARDESDLDRIAALVAEHEVTEVIVGEPRHLSGASGASAKEARAYSRALAGRIDPVPVHLVDERLSTVSAASSLRANGLDSRQQRGVIDQAAAVVVLQAYLDAQRERP
ncbi:Holliday junction resolvase RuvX [Geodermatophilus sp. DSM 44513]|uniref:Holliday junction resolvase RuvX n=1 Tax=Geodermatophilus sp. DSM 44513 TaxID=1528104 RepID=UPI0028F72937|nr:Holliday junction resolvase RuvX [Geodermatophilus sp. DSM 44513]WNV77467.1 Holliday junction resolvase RuvX [Geodermatophilus sp. DSM 44513]